MRHEAWCITMPLHPDVPFSHVAEAVRQYIGDTGYVDVEIPEEELTLDLPMCRVRLGSRTSSPFEHKLYPDPRLITIELEDGCLQIEVEELDPFMVAVTDGLLDVLSRRCLQEAG